MSGLVIPLERPIALKRTVAYNVTVTDLFAGAGGSSTGMVNIPGVHVRYAANHWQLACDIHNANHPDTDHAAVDLHQEDPRFFAYTDILWASPECTKWSQANGSSLPAIEEGLFEDPLSNEAANRSRLLMFDVLRFADHHRYRMMVIENVVDIATQSKYRTAWDAWRTKLIGLGYEFRVVSLNAMHAQTFGAPAPQSRDRIYIVCWLAGERAPDIDRILRPLAHCSRCGEMVESSQSWKNGRKVGKYRQQYVYVHGACGTVVEPGWLPASSAIDWSIPGERIGDKKKPLADKTRARIAAGIARYWGPLHIEASGNQYDAADPKHPNHGDPDAYYRAWPTDDVFRTLHTRETKALVIPVEGRDGKVAQPASWAMRTQTTRQESAMVVPSGGTWNEDARRASEPMPSLTTRDAYAAAHLPFQVDFKGTTDSHVGRSAQPVSDPMSTVQANGNHHAFVTQFRDRVRDLDPGRQTLNTIVADGANHALVTPYYGASTSAMPVDEPVGTLTTVDRYALVHRMNTGGAEMTTPAFEELRTLATAGHQALLQSGPRGGRPKVTPSDLKVAEAMVDEVFFRMFRPLECAAGMAFPTDYKWDVDVTNSKGKTVTPNNRDLVKAIGNAVCPPCSRDILAVCVEALTGEQVAA
jgi:DNA (cytosine-5)-methyltransferase 1